MRKTIFTLSMIIASVAMALGQTYSTPTWTSDGGVVQNDAKWKNTYVTGATSTGGVVNLNYTASSRPDPFTYVHPTAIEVESGKPFSLHLVAFSLGAYSTTTVRQDLRYTCAYFFADFDGNGTFETALPKKGNQPPTNNVGGNYEVLDITGDFTAPTVTTNTNGRIRVIYHNAWGALTSADGPVKEGVVYDFNVLIKNTGTGVESQTAGKYKVSFANDALNISGLENSNKIEVFDYTGKVIKKGVATSSVYTGILNAPKGIYLVKITDKTNASTVIKTLKN